jgi:hypothetical protein
MFLFASTPCETPVLLSPAPLLLGRSVRFLITCLLGHGPEYARQLRVILAKDKEKSFQT